MKTLVLAAALACLCLTSPGCASVPPIGPSTVAASSVDDRGLAVALAAYDATQHAWTAAVSAGRVPRDVVARVRPVRLKAVQVRKAAWAAYGLGNAADLDAQIKALKQLTAELRGFVPPPA